MKRIPTIWSEHLVNGTIYHEFPENSVYEFFKERTVSALNNVAIEFEGARMTYADLLEQVDIAASSLLQYGIKKGDIVTIVSPNIPQAIVTVYAVNKVGAISNILHPLLPAEEIHYHINNTDSKAVFILDRLYDKIQNAKWTGISPLVILYTVSDALSFPRKLLVKEKKLQTVSNNILYWKTFLSNGGKKTIGHASSPDDIALILYSSGTTGVQKGVCLTNRNLNCYAVQCHEVGECIQNACSLAVLPIFHGFGLCSAILNMLSCCSHLYLLPTYDPVKCNRLIFKKRIEAIYAVPAIYDALVHSKEMQTRDYSFLKYMFCGGDQIRYRTEHTFNAYMEKIGSPTRIIAGYGLTECVAGCLGNALFWSKEGTAGMVFPDTKAKIIQPGTEEELPVGTPGELCICSPCVMKGYYKNEEATQKVLHVHKDGNTWLHTGDVFSVDEDGFYTFHSRLGRMLVVNGYNVYPEMVEKALMKIPEVTQCCVVGRPAHSGGDQVIAVVCVKDNSIAPKQVIDRCKAYLPEYALPLQVIIKEKLPLSKVGKIDYKKVAEEINHE